MSYFILLLLLQLPEIEFFHRPSFPLGQKPTQTADTAEILLMLPHCNKNAIEKERLDLIFPAATCTFKLRKHTIF